ncbi:MAG TPA: penicillin-binding protein [Eubacterium sp.]|nr:penicillin-binding protein [Eubacterium sp.]
MFKEDLKIIWDYVKNILRSRLLPLIIFSVVLFGILIYKLFNLQIIHGDEYKVNYAQKSEKTLVLNSTRGNIYDVNGELLAYNKLAYSVIIEDSSTAIKNTQLNQIIVEMYDIIQENGDSYTIDYPIRLNKYGKFEFTKSGNNLLRYLRDIYGHKYISQLTDEERNATAADVIDVLKSKSYYNISDEYSDEEVLEIIYVRSNLAAHAYQRYISFTVATNVSEETMAAILENSDRLIGVTVKDEYVRCYNYGKYIAHLIGYTGKVSADELAELQKDDPSYQASDVVGKSGVEKSYEQVLNGTKGSRTVLVDSYGRVLQIIDEKEPVTGSDIYLTIDVKLTQKIYDLLERRLAEILITRIVNSDSDRVGSEEGDVVVIPIKDVYFALFDNNTISIDMLKENHEAGAAASIYSVFDEKRGQLISAIDDELHNTKTAFSSLSEEMQEYIRNVRSILLNGGILNSDAISSTDELSVAWTNGEISLTDYLYNAIAKDWVNIYNLDVEDEYPTMDDVLDAMLSYAMEELRNNDAFDKLVIKYLVQGGQITGRETCLLLMEQNCIPYTMDDYDAVANGLSPYDYIINQINELNITPAMLALDPCSGAVVLENSQTGSIIAMVTYPSYDINNFSGSIDSNYYASLLADKSTPLVNRATQTRIAPGSTFKIATAIAGLMEGVITPNETITDTGIFDKVKPNLKCWYYPNNHGAINVKQAIGVSCNYFFCEVGYRLASEPDGSLNAEKGLAVLKKYAEELGIATKTGIQISEATPNPSNVSVIASTIGQGNHAYTALNLARYTSTIGNGGTVYNSSVISKVVDSNGDVIELFEPVVANEVELDSVVWDSVYEGGRNVILGSGVGTQLFDKYLPVAVGGKSGTAEENKNRGSHANYITWAPYNNAEVAVAVMIPNGYAAVNAGIMSFYTLSSYYDSYIPSHVYADVNGALTIVE